MVASVLSADGKRWLYGDAFGVTRLNVGKSLKLKHTIKVTTPRGGLSIGDAGKLALAPGRVQTGVYGDDGVALLNLPGLGVRGKLAGSSERARLLGAGDAARIVELGRGDLVVSSLDGAATKRLRALALNSDDAARSLPKQAIGPQGDGGWPPLRAALCVARDGRFAAAYGGRLWGGRVDDDGDELAWTLELAIHPTVAIDLQRAGDETWLTVMDHAAGRARLLRVTDAGALEQLELASLAGPRVTETWLLYQPESGVVVRRARASGEETRFDVAPYNAHPRPEPELEVYKGRARPPAPTRLPGQLDAIGERVLFVPWHGETIVELRAGVVLDREIGAGAGPLRRAIVEVMARDNAALARLQLQVELRHFDTNPKGSSCSFGVELPECVGAIGPRVACEFAGKLTDRYELRTHGWGWSSAGQHGGVHGSPREATPEEARAILEWMRDAELLPLELDRDFRRLYTELLGIPHDPQPERRPLSRAAERLWLRATLETIRAGGWPEGPIPASWSEEPITPALAIAAIPGLRDWGQYRPYEGLHLLSCLLAHHLGVDAQPVLLALIAADAKPFNWKQYRDAGELLVWLCHRHAELRGPTIAALEAIEHPDVSEWAHEQKTVLEALRRGARHLWSNG